MKNLLLMMLLFPIFVSAQEYGDASAPKKIIVARFETPFKKEVFTKFGQQMADKGYYVNVIKPEEYVVPIVGVLTIYGEGALKGQPWDDKLREFIANNSDAIYVHTCKKDGLPPIATGVDVISAASTDASIEQTVKTLITRAKAKME